MGDGIRHRSPVVVVLSGPGGAGKGTIASALVERDDCLALSRSWTTRPRRVDDAADAYVFVDSAAWSDHAHLDGFQVADDQRSLRWRRSGTEWVYTKMDDTTAVFHVAQGSLTLQDDRPIAVDGDGEIDLKVPITMRLFLESWTDSDVVTWMPRAGEAR